MRGTHKLYRHSSPHRMATPDLVRCTLSAQAVFGQLLVGAPSTAVPGLCVIGTAALAELMRKPEAQVQSAVSELVVAALAVTDFRPGVQLICLPGVPYDHIHWAGSAKVLDLWLRVVRELSVVNSDVLRRHVDELVQVALNAIRDRKYDKASLHQLLGLVDDLQAHGGRTETR